ncbi:MAG TPA: acyl-CoA thioesterase [Ramlibacter sp.]|nr:acyl-CoA thioesterase [Ramlibacter sp.]
MIASYEALVSRDPFVVEKRVRWADCDPAGVVYTGKFSEYLLTAVGYLFDELGQGHYAKWLSDLGVDTPCKGMDLEFHGALWPEDRFRMHCGIGAIRTHSYDIRVEATQEGGRRVFSGRFSPICISRDVRQRAPIPARMLAALQRLRLPDAASQGAAV